jgi:hypothetical protein
MGNTAIPFDGGANAGRPFPPVAATLAVIALAIPLLVSIVALSALAVAVDARDQAADAQSRIDSGFAPNATPPAPPEPDEAVSAPSHSEPPADHTASPEDTATPTDVLNPQAVYTPVYSGEVLNPQVTGKQRCLCRP